MANITLGSTPPAQETEMSTSRYHGWNTDHRRYRFFSYSIAFGVRTRCSGHNHENGLQRTCVRMRNYDVLFSFTIFPHSGSRIYHCRGRIASLLFSFRKHILRIQRFHFFVRIARQEFGSRPIDLQWLTLLSNGNPMWIGKR